LETCFRFSLSWQPRRMDEGPVQGRESTPTYTHRYMGSRVEVERTDALGPQDPSSRPKWFPKKGAHPAREKDASPPIRNSNGVKCIPTWRPVGWLPGISISMGRARLGNSVASSGPENLKLSRHGQGTDTKHENGGAGSSEKSRPMERCTNPQMEN